MADSFLFINLNKFLRTRGLAKTANSDSKLKYITRFALANLIRIYKNSSWLHCRLDVINFWIHGGLYRKLTAATNEPQQWGVPQRPPRVGGPTCDKESALLPLVPAANFVYYAANEFGIWIKTGNMAGGQTYFRRTAGRPAGSSDLALPVPQATLPLAI